MLVDLTDNLYKKVSKLVKKDKWKYVSIRHYVNRAVKERLENEKLE